MTSSTPQLSVVIVTIDGLDGLTLPLPGLTTQTIASEIDLLIVAAPGRIDSRALASLEAFHSVRLFEVDRVANRGREAAAAVAEARAPFVAMHENHTRAEPGTSSGWLLPIPAAPLRSVL
jgi:hypothetical protein